MGMLLCEHNFRDVWSRNESVRAEIGQILHTHTHAAKLVVEIIGHAMWEIHDYRLCIAMRPNALLDMS